MGVDHRCELHEVICQSGRLKVPCMNICFRYIHPPDLVGKTALYGVATQQSLYLDEVENPSPPCGVSVVLFANQK